MNIHTYEHSPTAHLDSNKVLFKSIWEYIYPDLFLCQACQEKRAFRVLVDWQDKVVKMDTMEKKEKLGLRDPKVSPLC